MFVRLLCCALLTLLTLFCGTASAAPALQEPLYGAEAILYCAESGQTLYEKNADVPVPPASVTKLMTALIVLEQVDDLSQTVTVSDTAVQIERDSTHIGLVAGETVTLQDMLYATLMQSANDAANVLAEAVAGSQSAFSHMMNIRAAALGCTGSHFENAHGLDAHASCHGTRPCTHHRRIAGVSTLFTNLRCADLYHASNQQARRAAYLLYQTAYAAQGFGVLQSLCTRRQKRLYHQGAAYTGHGCPQGRYDLDCSFSWCLRQPLLYVARHAHTVRLWLWRVSYGHTARGPDCGTCRTSWCQFRLSTGPQTLPVGTQAQALSLSQQANEHGLRTLQMTRDGITQVLRTLPYPLSCDIQPVISAENAPSRFLELLIGSILTALLGIWFTEIHIVQKTTAPCRRYSRQRRHARHGKRF